MIGFDQVMGGNGRPVRMRFEWTSEAPDSAQWQQKFSYDQGRTWQVNWIMKLSRPPADVATSSLRHML